jgi:hypothetical protein
MENTLKSPQNKTPTKLTPEKEKFLQDPFFPSQFFLFKSVNYLNILLVLSMRNFLKINLFKKIIISVD